MSSALALALAPSAQAQVFPSGPVKLVAGYAEGGSVDLVARAIAPALSRRFSQTVTVQNIAGASGSIGAVSVALAPADGLTLLVGSPAEIGINHLISRHKQFDPFVDLTPIGMIGSQPLVWVASNKVPVRNVDEFLNYVESRPGQVHYASSGNGTPLHLAGETIKQLSGLRMTHVPYRGASLMLPDLIEGSKVQFAVMVLSSALPQSREGKIRIIGVASATRSSVAPDVPALGEHPRLRGLDASVWFAVFAPGKLPRPMADRLRLDLAAALTEPATRDALQKAGLAMMQDEETVPFLKAEIGRFTKVIEFAKLRDAAGTAQ